MVHSVDVEGQDEKEKPRFYSKLSSKWTFEKASLRTKMLTQPKKREILLVLDGSQLAP